MNLNTNSILVRLDESGRVMLEENGKSRNVLEWNCAVRVLFMFAMYPFSVKHYAICGNCIKICLPHTLCDSYQSDAR